jgi:hypothetical protein
MLGVSEYLLVYHTSGLTLSISGVFKVGRWWWWGWGGEGGFGREEGGGILGMIFCRCLVDG